MQGRCLLSVMDDCQSTPEVQSPLQRTFVIASILCFVSLLIVYYLAWPAVALLEAAWVQLLVYSAIPLLVTFVILYHSCWHPEIMGATRTYILILISSIMIVGVMCAIGVMLCFIWFCTNAVTGGPGPG
jgi:hypothetical protein